MVYGDRPSERVLGRVLRRGAGSGLEKFYFEAKNIFQDLTRCTLLSAVFSAVFSAISLPVFPIINAPIFLAVSSIFTSVIIPRTVVSPVATPITFGTIPAATVIVAVVLIRRIFSVAIGTDLFVAESTQLWRYPAIG